MYWYYSIIGLVLCGAAPSLEYDEKLRRYLHILYFPSVLFVLVMFAGLRGSSPDYGSYSGWFDSIASGNLVAQDWEKDPAFALVCYLVSALGIGFTGVTLFFAASAFISQLCFSRLAAGPRWVTLLFFLVVCRTFVGSDMASIRSAVAIPLMSCGIVLAFRGKKKTALILYIAALAFHLSVLIGLLPFVLSILRIRFFSRWWILSLATAAAIVEICLENVVELLSHDSRASIYMETAIGAHGPPRAYLAYIAARLLLLALTLAFLWDGISSESRMVFFCYAMGIFIQIVFIFNNALSWRGADIFGLFDMYVLILPLRSLTGGRRVLYSAAVAALGLAFVVSGMILEPYRWIFA
jgi:hypothetical protein